MEIRKDIVYRFFWVYGLFLLFAISIVVKMVDVYLDVNLRDNIRRLEPKEVTFDANRGDICAVDGRPLVTSVPMYTIYMDLGAEGVKEVFAAKVDSLALCLSRLYGDNSHAGYKKRLHSAYKKGYRYYRVNRKKITYLQLKEVCRFPIFRRGKFRGGFIPEEEIQRVYPFGNMALRTLGKLNKGAGSERMGAAGLYGIEQHCEIDLRGEKGLGVKDNLSGRWIPILSREPVDGCDVNTTIDINYQDVAQQALLKQLKKSNAGWGTVILMEVESGEIKAIANLGLVNGKYTEEAKNYALGHAGCSEPGSTFKTVSLMIALDQDRIDTSTVFDTGNGIWKYSKASIKDSDYKKGGHGELTISEIFKLSSNVGTAMAITQSYKGREQEKEFIDRIYNLGLNRKLDLGLVGEGIPRIKYPTDKDWWGTSLAMISFGYEIEMTPLQILTYYNAIANDGKMIKPLLIKSIRQKGREIRSFETEVLKSSICSSATLGKVQKMLEGVVESGTAKNLKNPHFKIAGKTGTAQVADKKHGYYHNGHRVYQASFVGYFPADNPKYSCIVVVNKPRGLYYGSYVAGPVFREIVNKVYSTDIHLQEGNDLKRLEAVGSIPDAKSGYAEDVETVLDELDIEYLVPEKEEPWITAREQESLVRLEPRGNKEGRIPFVVGMCADDAIFLLENAGLNVKVNGMGKVRNQSLRAGDLFRKGQTIQIRLR